MIEIQLMCKLKIVFVLIGTVLSQGILAQQSLDLFQATDSPNDERTTNRRPQRETQRATEPAFTLVGTSRFGNEYHASLLHRDGSPVQVEWTQGSVVDIKGHSGFGLAQVSSRQVSIRVPESEPCVASELKGVTCNGRFAVLSLSNATPVVREIPDRAIAGNSSEEIIILDSGDSDEQQIIGEPGQETIGNTNVLLRNPFSGELQQARDLTPEELAEREERGRERAERFRNFEIVRIADDEIPEGMQRIRTPFGDRLEEIEE